MRQGTVRWMSVCFLLVCIQLLTSTARAQISGPPSVNCHVTDGQFTSCPNGVAEWSDVQPVAFPASNSYLYVNQDAAHTYLYLMYDFPFRVTPLAPTDSVHINFDTVEQGTAGPSFVVYDIYIYGNGQLQVLQQGNPTPAGNISGAAGFGVSPNSSSPHVTAELRVPLQAGPPSTYSPDPLFWNASLPPSPPPNPCPTQPGKTYNDCVKKQAGQDALQFALESAALGAAGYACTAATLLACTPLETPLILASIGLGAMAAEMGYIAGDPAGLILTIPPDPNYTILATPATYSFSPSTAGLTPQEAAAVTAWFASFEQILALQQAAITSIARAEGASAAGSPVWVTTQTQAAKEFSAQAGILLTGLQQLQSNLQAALVGAGTQFTLATSDVATYQSLINPSSPASEAQQEFALGQQMLTQLGVSGSDQTVILQLILGADPVAAAALGIGAFPQLLTDPTTNAAVQAVGTGLVQNAPSPTSLSPSFNVTLPGDYISGGIGLRGQTAGNITISGIPSGASIVRAFLYWGMLDNGEDVSLHQLTLNGTAISGSLIGSGPDTCWGLANSFTYRAEVTSLISGNGVYQLTGVASGGSILAEGASLVVIYQLAGLPVKTIMLDDGNLAMPFGTSTGTASFGNFTATGPVSAFTTFMVGDGQGLQFGIQTPTSFTGSGGTISFPNVFNATDGPYWDTDTFDVSSVVGVGSSNGSATITIAGDCLLWSAQSFSVTSTPLTTPVTATAAVVEANSNGDTVAKLRGLAPTDAPDLTDQIAMVVQFRTIQNPSLSSSTLTNQLVTGLVNDGVITSTQAATIETTVAQNLVSPPMPPKISAAVMSKKVVSESHDVSLVRVVVQFTDTGIGKSVNTQLVHLVPAVVRGRGAVTINSQSPGLPDALGTLAVGASTTATFYFNVPESITQFSLTESGTMQDMMAHPYTFTATQLLKIDQ